MDFNYNELFILSVCVENAKNAYPVECKELLEKLNAEMQKKNIFRK